MDVGSHGPRDEPAGDAGEPRVTADAEGTAEPKGRCLVDEEAASAQDDEIAAAVEQTGLPADDPVRFGPGALTTAVLGELGLA